MKPMTFVRQVGLALIFIMVSSVVEAKKAIAQETTVAQCESPSQSIQIYSEGDQMYLRALDRQTGNVWMRHTPVSINSTDQEIQYTNLIGEPSVTLFVNANGKDCAVQVGSNPLEAGALVVSGMPILGEPANQAQILYSEQFRTMEEKCQTPSTLSIRPIQNEGQAGRLSFICWSSPDSEGFRSGEWLGNLPLNLNDPTFTTSFTCSAGDQVCQTQLSLARSRFPDVLEQAELACSIKDGTLFFASADGDEEIDLRCGYFATTFFDSNGDDIPDYEDSVSVDILVGQWPVLQ